MNHFVVNQNVQHNESNCLVNEPARVRRSVLKESVCEQGISPFSLFSFWR